jgi:hypothetical protein
MKLPRRRKPRDDTTPAADTPAPARDTRCNTITKAERRCQLPAMPGDIFCRLHRHVVNTRPAAAA